MIRSVGIDLSRTGRHQVRALDEQAKPCDSFSFDNTLEGQESLEKRIFSDGTNPTVMTNNWTRYIYPGGIPCPSAPYSATPASSEEHHYPQEP